uniref:ATP-binding protein n=1 Tax=Agathobacter sp. TaxID=2021311 RepID=UPI004055B19A
MENNSYEKMNKRQVELIVLVIYSIYCGSTLVMGNKSGWNSWGLIGILVQMLFGWFFFFAKYKTYQFRAYYVTIVCQFNILFYAYYVNDVFEVLSTFSALVILLGLYEIPRIIGIPFISYTLMLFYFDFIKDTVHATNVLEHMRIFLRFTAVYLVEIVMYFMMKKQESAKKYLKHAIGALKKTEKQKDDFLANISHEIRTPINSICGISEIMLKGDVPPELQDDILNIRSAGRNLMAVVGDILDFSELQEENFELVQENYHITSTIYDVINMTMARKEEKNLELIVNCDISMPGVLIGDEQKIRRIILNIVNNAIKFTNEGCITVGIGYRRESYGINLIITVKDTGIGMSKEVLENLFEKYSQADTGRDRRGEGIGLGLAIVQVIVNKMGGFITAKSELGKGSEFQVVIPQKIYDETPIAKIENKEDYCAAVYIDMEQFAYTSIRDEYANNIQNMISQLDIKCYVCRNLQELKRRDEAGTLTHIFISLVEYKEDSAYFDDLAKRTCVSIIIDHYDDAKVPNKAINRIYKPFFILSIFNVLRSKDEAGILVSENELDASSVHVLVVDDNRMNIRVVEGLLKEYQIQVSFALSGEEALKKVKTKEYDLIFMDHMMPGMDGVEALHRIRSLEDDYFKQIPVIALTANAIAGAREMFIREGFNDFVPKPIESSVLLRALKRHIVFRRNVAQNEKKAQILENLPNEVRPANQKQVEETLEIGDLDVKKGLLYCGNKKNYISILEAHLESGREHIEWMKQLYAQGNWKDYTVAVHGTKSSAMNIGAVKLSEMAKKLEAAGKEQNLTYIRKHHESMLTEYERVLVMISNWFAKNGETKAEKQNINAPKKPVISHEELEQALAELEDASYMLDGEQMMRIIEHLENYSFGEKNLEEVTAPIRKKIEMCDYMSAYENLKKQTDKLA